jgi:hypothetical protein
LFEPTTLDIHVMLTALFSLNVAVPQLRQLVAGFIPRRPGFDPRSGLVVHNTALGQVFYEYFGFTSNSQSTDCSTFTTIIRGWYNRPISGGRTKWIQSQPPTLEKNSEFL